MDKQINGEPLADREPEGDFGERIDRVCRQLATHHMVQRRHRKRQDKVLTLACVLVHDIAKADAGTGRVYQELKQSLERSSAAVVKCRNELDVCWIMLGRNADKRLVNRLASAARHLATVMPNDPGQYISDHRGVTGCARLWTDGKTPKARQAIEPLDGSTSKAEPAPNLPGRGCLAAVEVAEDGKFRILAAVDKRFALVSIVEKSRWHLVPALEAEGQNATRIFRSNLALMQAAAEGKVKVEQQSDDLAVLEAARDGQQP